MVDNSFLCTYSSLWELEFVFHPISSMQFFNHLLTKKVKRKCSRKGEKESSRRHAVPTPFAVIAPLCAGGWRNHYTDVLWRGHFHFVFPMRDRFMVQGSLHSGLKENLSYHIPNAQMKQFERLPLFTQTKLISLCYLSYDCHNSKSTEGRNKSLMDQDFQASPAPLKGGHWSGSPFLPSGSLSSHVLTKCYPTRNCRENTSYLFRTNLC